MLSVLLIKILNLLDMAIGAIIAGIGALAGTLIAQSKQNKANRAIAEFQANANRQSLREQLEYNSPKSQMTRFQEAGLNPNLIYGNGSASAGNQSAPLTYPDIKPTDYSGLMNILPLINQTRLADSQVQAQDATIRSKTAMVELNRLQARVLEKNPLLNDAGFKAIIDSLKSSAEIKASESGIKKMDQFVAESAAGWQVNKIAKEVQLLEQRFNLGTQDSAIKAQILKSKEFQNAILEVQKKFMTDGEITPQHILTFIQLLLMKAL